MYKYLSDEIPKYRKKKKKTVKKANHKHDWKCYLIKNDIEEEPFKTSNMALLSPKYKCIICGEVKDNYIFANMEKYKEFIENATIIDNIDEV